MTTVANLYNGGQATSGVTYNLGALTFDVADMNAVITAYNTANSTAYPIYDTVEDNFEKFIQFLMIYLEIQGQALGFDTFNTKLSAVASTSEEWGIRGFLNSRAYTVGVLFNDPLDIFGDPDNVG